jgi:thiol-disulfide isomerase/thioredoxin
MNKLFLVIVIMILSHGLYAQSDYEILRDKQSGQKVYKGVCTFQDLHAENTFGWMKRNYDTYKPDSNDIKYLRKYLPSYSLITFIGTWCDDTHKLLPRLEKILTITSFPTEHYTMFGVDREKKAKYVENRLYSIENVPTIIVFKGHQEIGRIVETVKKSIEADLVDIIKKDVDQTEAAKKDQH